MRNLVNALRVRLAIRLDNMAHNVAPNLPFEERERLIARVARYSDTRATRRGVRVVRPDGLTTTHEPPAPSGG